MAKQFSLQETLDYILDSIDGEDVEDAASEDFDQASDTEDNLEQDQDHNETDEENSNEEDADEEPNTYLSRNRSICWTSSPPPHAITSKTALQMTPEITRYACSHAEDIKSTFELFFTEEIQKIVLEMSNVEGRQVFADEWKDLSLADHVGLLILSGVYRSKNEAMESLWHPESGRAIFRAVMTLKMFRKISSVIRFDDKETRIA
ncbi:piggyBac transposable element-derived 4-like protein [Labeo rohita]|uniref:PiggyBac transposable element-derived 4-like protein n=1 Tax=Labeo rohita TaxID=84645 RepID=A0A498NMC0_LABRO|nr:piggyBac transposable element-derived 4-like protein [Labeo rohita]